jgi:hypothetical protein
MAEKKNNSPNFRKQARRDVNLAHRDELLGIKRDMRGARNDTRQGMTQVKSIYEALGNQLAQYGNEFQDATRALSQGYRDDMQGLAGLLPGFTAPTNEVQANDQVFGSLGSGALGVLATQRGMGSNAQRGYQTAGATESAIRRANMVSELQDFLSQSRYAKQDIRKGMPKEILSQLQSLRNDWREYDLARDEFGLRERALDAQILSDEALRAYYKSLLSQPLPSAQEHGRTGRRRNGDGPSRPHGSTRGQ